MLRPEPGVPGHLPARPALQVPAEHASALHQALHRERGVQHRRAALREHHDLPHAAHQLRRRALSLRLHQDIRRPQRDRPGHRHILR